MSHRFFDLAFTPAVKEEQRRRGCLKLLGRLQLYQLRERPDLAIRLDLEGDGAESERLAVVTVEAFDWNCPRYVTPRFTVAEIERIVAPLRARIAELEARLPARTPVLARS